jgi:hypothetical protein
MARKNLSDHSWLIFLILAIGLVVACSSSSTPSDEDSGGGGHSHDSGPEAMTKS